MFGLPEQDLEEAQHDLGIGLELAPEHISYYQLTLEPNTAFHHQPPSLPDEGVVWEMQRGGLARLSGCGFDRYEVSAYARPGRRCRHNLNYWGFGDYLGIGAGAHSKLTDTRTGRVIRYAKPRQPAEYLASIGGPAVRTGLRELDSADLVAEFMLNALRLVEGFPLGLLEERTGVPLQAVEATLSRACRRGLLERHGEWLRPTELGRSFLDDLTAMFLL
jgi:oxygen-independent coproporphyrinogen-3 oxidase